MNDLRTAAQQALEALKYFRDTAICSADTDAANEVIPDLEAALAQQAEPVLQTCNCRWDGEVQVQQCTLHEAHIDAIHEWAERAKVAERKLAQQAEPHQDLRAALQAPGCERLREWVEIGPVQRAALETFAAALAQQAEPVEPYCYIYEYDGVFGLHREFYPLPYNGMKPSRTVPVYTAPPQRKPLTEEEIDALPWNGSPRQFARAVERAHGIGEKK